MITEVPPKLFNNATTRKTTSQLTQMSRTSSKLALRYIVGGQKLESAASEDSAVDAVPKRELLAEHRATYGDLICRQVSAELSRISLELKDTNTDFVPICHSRLPRSTPANDHSVMRVALEALPMPDESCALQDILDFKAELRSKQWGFRRWLKTLATKHQTEGEIRDELEWLTSEYSNAMRIHKLKASEGFFEAYVIPAIENYGRLREAQLEQDSERCGIGQKT